MITITTSEAILFHNLLVEEASLLDKIDEDWARTHAEDRRRIARKLKDEVGKG